MPLGSTASHMQLPYARRWRSVPFAMSEHANRNSNKSQEAKEEELCTQCMTGNRPGSHFCCKCGAPLSSYAATAPFEAIFAEGHAFRRAAEQPQRLIVVMGIWVIFGTMAFAAAVITFTSWDLGDRFGFLGGMGVLSVSVLLIVKTTKNYRNRQVTKNDDHG